MKKVFVIAFVLTIPLSLYGVQRKVLGELMTNTSCGGCASANEALDNVMQMFPTQFVVIRYHAWWPSSSDPFYAANPSENSARVNFYGADYTPHLWIDGHVDGGYIPGPWPSYIQGELNIPTSIAIDMQVQYDSTKNTGVIYVTVSNESDTTHDSLYLYYVITESNIYYPAPNGSTIHNQVMRDMIPDADGIPINVPPHQSISNTQDFTIDPRWDETNCQVVVFVQSHANKHIYQADAKWLFTYQELGYTRYRVDDSAGGNGDDVPQPGETVNLYVSVENTGRMAASPFTATLTSSSQYINVVTSTVSYDSLGIFNEEESNSPFVLQIDPNTPDGYLTWLTFTITAGSNTFTDSIPFMVTTHSGFSDDMEHGDTLWTHGGSQDYWSLSTRRSHSPDYSWYNGDETTHRYVNNMDNYLESPWVVIPSNASLSFYYFIMAETNYDYGYLEIFNGKSWKKMKSYTGTHLWTVDSIGLENMDGMAIKFRFHFVSDESITREGWYIDDVRLGPATSVSENVAPVLKVSEIKLLRVTRKSVSLLVNSDHSGRIQFKIYNPAGRLEMELSRQVVEGNNIIEIPISNLRPGIHFVRANKQIVKFLFVR